MKSVTISQIERTYAMADTAAHRFRRMGFKCEVERESFGTFAVVDGPSVLTVGSKLYPRACSLLVRPVSWIVREYEDAYIREHGYILVMGTDNLSSVVSAIRLACERRRHP